MSCTFGKKYLFFKYSYDHADLIIVGYIIVDEKNVVYIMSEGEYSVT